MQGAANKLHLSIITIQVLPVPITVELALFALESQVWRTWGPGDARFKPIQFEGFQGAYISLLSVPTFHVTSFTPGAMRVCLILFLDILRTQILSCLNMSE